MQIIRRIHPHFEGGNPKYGLSNSIGKYQYIFTSKKGQISLIQLNYSLVGQKNSCYYEIYCLSGDLFQDVIRFDSFDEAFNKVKEFLETE